MFEGGRLGAVVALVLGFVVGYKWPKIRKQIDPWYRKTVKQATKYTKQGIQDAVKLFDGGPTRSRKATRRAATAAA